MSNSSPFFAQLRRSARQRASDADREQCAQLLRDAFADGRLDSTDLHERSSALWGAKTHGDLTKLVDDLVTAPPPAARKPALPGAPTPQQAKRARNIVATVFFVFSLLLSLVGIAIAVLVAQRTDEAPDNDTDLFTSAGLTAAVDAFIETSGDSRFVEINLDAQGAYATVSGADLRWSDGRVTEVDTDAPAEDAALFDAHDDLDLDGIGELVDSAPELTGISDPVTRNLTIRRTDSTDRPIEVSIWLANDRKEARIVADGSGDVIG